MYSLKTFIILITTLTFYIGIVKGQQRPRYSQYMFNQLAINPAYAGINDALDISLIYRTQWVNVNKAPISQTITASTSIPDKSMGVGLILYNHTEGVQRETSGNLVYSFDFSITDYKGYRRKVTPSSGYFDNMRLSLGAQLGLTQYTQDLKSLKVVQDGIPDPVFEQDNINSFLVDIGMGAFLYTNRFYLGASIPNFLKSDLGLDNAPNSIRNRHYFITSSIVLTVNDWLDIKPKLLLRFVEHADFQYDFNLNFLFIKKIWVGGSYRHQESFVALFDINVSKNIRIGYSFDYGLNSFTKVAGGSHEILVNYNLKREKDSRFSPKYY